MDDSVHSPGPASSIKAIDRTSVHRICSGQVVLTLATAVKELVENSIDAGATSIEVRLKEYGAELIEVIDNGQGVEEENFQGLTLKHHTSKLRDFNDLVGVETFGFRGEALSSLCALSNLTIVTRHKDAAVATKLEFDNNGKIKSQTPSARQVGTTLSLGQLFHTLPVRHKEFLRNVKKEFNKMVHVLNGYCVISTGVRITCTNQTNKGKKSVIVSTNGNESIRENITNIFGPKQFQSLIPFSQVLPSDTVCGDFHIKVPEAKVFSIEGYVSSSEHGQGRGSSDRQFVFVNRRPCDLAKVTRIVNEVYHSYNKHQFPFVVLDVSLAKECVDVNVTPDKRQIFISEEKLLLATIKTSLIQMFEPISSMYQVNNGQPKGNSLVGSPFCQIQKNQTNGNCPVGVLKKSASCPYTSPKVSLTSSLASLKRSFSSAFVKTTGDVDSSEASPSHRKPDKQRRLDTFVHVESASPAMRSPVRSVSAESSSTTGDITLESPTRNKRVTLPETDPDCILHSEQTDSPPTESKELTKWGNIEILSNPELPPKEEKRQFKEKYREESILPVDFEQERREELPSETPSAVQGPVPEYTDQAQSVVRSSRTVPFSISQLRARLKRRTGVAEADRDKFRSFRARISPTDNQAAEDELKKEIKKDMFAKMEILGQFNLGFIIARSGSDLFIIDQHATDEKYNFETLQKECVIRSQKLIQPQRLELTAANSSILIDNIDIFRTNGFEFEIDEEAPIATRVKLSSMPVSKNWTFGKDDIEELIFMLSDSPGVLCRPSRVRMMFASRACRKSIMVGTALSRAEMRKVVNHMGEIEQPWNCPHGRPTMRHLINLDCLEDLEK